MNKLLKKTLNVMSPLVLGGFILFWVYRDFDFAKAREVLLHEMNWWWMLFSLIFGVLAQVFRGWRWRQTLEPLDAFPKRAHCVDAIFISYAASLVVPRIGEVSRCRSEEHTSELQSRQYLVCRLLLEKKQPYPVNH